jgi:hypothetical protein
MRAIAATSWGPSEFGIFWLESDFSMHYKAWNGTTWTGDYSLGATFVSVPAAASGWTCSASEPTTRCTTRRSWTAS